MLLLKLNVRSGPMRGNARFVIKFISDADIDVTGKGCSAKQSIFGGVRLLVATSGSSVFFFEV